MPAWLNPEAKAARTNISGDCIRMKRVGRSGEGESLVTVDCLLVFSS